MKINVGPEKSQALSNLLSEARAEADRFRRRLGKVEQILLSTRLIMGHELKKPVTAISGYLDLALEDMDSLPVEDIRGFLEKARGECGLLNELNLFFLELLKVEEREEILHGSKVNLREFVHEVLDHLSSVFDVSSRIKTRLSPYIRDFHINPNAFKIILTNIIENALTYSSEDSQVLVDIRRVPDKRGMHNRHLLKIRVTDHGVGIPAADLKKIFVPFVRLHEDIADGAGLGLTLVRSLVELHDGDLFIKSKVNEGTTVHVTIPEATEGDEQQGKS